MSSCTINRWGKGTTTERPINTVATKELQERLEAIKNERAEQDRMWDEDDNKVTSKLSQLKRNFEYSKYTTTGQDKKVK
jgi:hypothetical protein